MSFPKGRRFEPQPISDVPGPNSYNLCQESQLDAYKRGAFLEKTERFSQDLPSDVPGPGEYNTVAGKTDLKPISRPPQNSGDRYAFLQRKVEDLERIHIDGKKAHQVEVDRLKLELSRTQKTLAEQSERLEKQKKQNATLDVRIQELRKASSIEQAELKDLRVKLRTGEHARAQLSLKQGEAGDLKKAMQSLESKRRDEIRERDRTIADLEKSATGEKKRREVVEARLQELRGKDDVELEAARDKSQSLQAQLMQSQEETRRTVQLLADTETKHAQEQRFILDQLEQHRRLLALSAAEYGRLCSETVSVTAHSKLKHEYGVLQLRTWRLERKLANADGQILELVNLIHHAHDTSTLLKRQIQDLQKECDFRRITSPDRNEDIALLTPLYDELCTAMHDIHEAESSLRCSDNLVATLLAELYRLACDRLVVAYVDANMELEQQGLMARDLRVELSNIQIARENLETALEKIRKDQDERHLQLAEATRMIDEMKTSAVRAEEQRSELEHRMKLLVEQNEIATSGDKKALQQLAETVKRNRMTEDGLRAEIQLLTAELADCEQFQSAYYSLSDEVKSLIARNELAEGEAHQLSKFNAEILGHHNPAQRIMYVDRIRRELAEIKHKLAVTVVECESFAANNTNLLRELEMYKSASMPLENKPRTIVTRISRPPLSALNQTTTANWEPTDAGQRMNFEDFSYAI
ncbi:hypothetical protein C8R43DRAFT_1023572 [Mycena crocata]|nr:hypothetical protein C8R43DRAFT_1023572 [Mycena crocata]